MENLSKGIQGLKYMKNNSNKTPQKYFPIFFIDLKKN